MARKIRDAELDTREARGKLKPRGKPYWRTIERGLHLGFRRLKGKAGTWCARHYRGEQQYEVESIGVADDLSDADGLAILDYWQAQDKARERMVSRVHSAAGKSGPLTVKAATEQYLEKLASEGKPVYDTRRRVEAFIYPKLGDIECNALTADMLRKWKVGVAEEPARLRTAKGKVQQYRALNGDDEAPRRRQASANRVLTILKAALNLAWREKKVPSDAEWRRVEPFKKVAAARIRYLTVAEGKRLINAASDRGLRPLVQAALQTGARYGELAKLQVHDFNPKTGKIAIRQSKSGKPRHVVLTEEGVSLFKQLSTGRLGSDLLIRKANGSAWGKSHQAHPMAEACARAKIKPAISFHGLRHTYASLAVMNDMPLLVVAKNLGHADTRMIEKHYGHLADSYVDEAIRAGAPRFGMPKASNVRQLEGSS